MAASIRATPRNELLNLAGSGLNRIKQALNNARVFSPEEQRVFSPRSSNTAPIGDLLLGGAPEALQDWSYEGSRGPISGRNIQTMRIDPRVLDVAGLAAVGAPGAIKAARAAAPTAAKQAVQLMEKYGVSPMSHIVAPEGNLRLTSRITTDSLKGPEKQSVESFIQQIKSIPGVTKEGLAQIAAKYDNPKAVITKQQFEDNMPASQYEKVDLKDTQDNAFEHYYQEALENVDSGDVWVYSGLPEEYGYDLNEVAQGYLPFSELDKAAQREVKDLLNIKGKISDDKMSSILYDYAEEQHGNMVHEYAMGRADMQGDSEITPYAYVNEQRLIAGKPEEGYFEFGVTHPDQTAPYNHYSSDKVPEGLIGHVRGTLTKEPTIIEGGIEVPSNTYLVEEFQSDAQKKAKQTGALHQVHGTLFKAAIQDALEKGADRIYIPTAYPIAKARGKSVPDKYVSIYDQAVMKEGLDPLRHIPGVKVNPIIARHLNEDLSITDVPYYQEITIDPQAYDIITNKAGQATPGYGIQLKDYTKGFAAGGLVYDDSQIDALADDLLQGYAEGGEVDMERLSIPEKAVAMLKILKAAKHPQLTFQHGSYPNRIRKELVTDYPEEVGTRRTNRSPLDVAINYGGVYDLASNPEMNPQDLRDIALAYQLFDYVTGDKADAIRDYKENMAGISAAERDRSTNRRATDKEVAQRAKDYAKQQTTAFPEYAEGGLVYDPEHIEALADQLLG